MTDDVDDEYKFYYGLAESLFKERLQNYTKSFNHQRYQKERELPKYNHVFIALHLFTGKIHHFLKI